MNRPSRKPVQRRQQQAAVEPAPGQTDYDRLLTTIPTNPESLAEELRQWATHTLGYRKRNVDVLDGRESAQTNASELIPLCTNGVAMSASLWFLKQHAVGHAATVQTRRHQTAQLIHAGGDGDISRELVDMYTTVRQLQTLRETLERDNEARQSAVTAAMARSDDLAKQIQQREQRIRAASAKAKLLEDIARANKRIKQSLAANARRVTATAHSMQVSQPTKAALGSSTATGTADVSRLTFATSVAVRASSAASVYTVNDYSIREPYAILANEVYRSISTGVSLGPSTLHFINTSAARLRAAFPPRDLLRSLASLTRQLTANTAGNSHGVLARARCDRDAAVHELCNAIRTAQSSVLKKMLHPDSVDVTGSNVVSELIAKQEAAEVASLEKDERLASKTVFLEAALLAIQQLRKASAEVAQQSLDAVSDQVVQRRDRISNASGELRSLLTKELEDAVALDMILSDIVLYGDGSGGLPMVHTVSEQISSNRSQSVESYVSQADQNIFAIIQEHTTASFESMGAAHIERKTKHAGEALMNLAALLNFGSDSPAEVTHQITNALIQRSSNLAHTIDSGLVRAQDGSDVFADIKVHAQDRDKISLQQF
ncbi:hypothetical protein GQ42DRAFT_154228 [Ramicandelaber brevisporus]|nr:hypothetical protein GQ42DRAFT_154228 [Ramicandelaber brevisporus]